MEVVFAVIYTHNVYGHDSSAALIAGLFWVSSLRVTALDQEQMFIFHRFALSLGAPFFISSYFRCIGQNADSVKFGVRSYWYDQS